MLVLLPFVRVTKEKKMSGNNFDKKNIPVDGGKSFLADWEGVGASGVQTIEIQAGDDVSFEVPVRQVAQRQQQQQSGPNGNAQMGGDGYDWHPSEDLG